ncbi:MAG: hypothetical protein R3C56_22965 [Pirellulaceae bacterium]
MLFDQKVVLDQEINVFPIRDTIDQPAGYTLDALNLPDNAADDSYNKTRRRFYLRAAARAADRRLNTPGEYSALPRHCCEAISKSKC